jgi:hypothetical protein
MSTCLSFRILAFGFVAFAVSPAQQAHAQVVFGGHTYLLTPTVATWTQAEALGVSIGGHLAAINSQAEQDFLVSAFVNASVPGGDRQPFWIGLRDIAQSPIIGGGGQNFQWTTGEPVVYTNWAPFEPNNDTGDEWYTAFNFHYGVNQSNTPGTWNDTTNIGSVAPNPYRGIVEINAVPEPCSFVLASTIAGVIALAHCKKRTRFRQ